MPRDKKGIVNSIGDGQLTEAHQAALDDLFENYYKRRHQIYAMNFYRGIFFGLGGVIGGTIVVALLLWLLSTLQFVPFLDGITRAVEHSLQNHR